MHNKIQEAFTISLPKWTSVLLYAAFFISITYLATIALTHKAGDTYSDIIDFIVRAPSNEVGDFFAGVFSPLAFLWLVVGYLLQSEELKLQRQELAEQRAEIAHGNVLIEAQASFIGEQARISTAHFIPFFVISKISSDDQNIEFIINNRSGKAYDLLFRNNYDYELESSEFAQNHSARFSIPSHINPRFSCDVEFTDAGGVRWTQSILFDGRSRSYPPQKLTNDGR